MLNRAFLFASLVAAILIVSMLFFTTPATIGPVGILFFYIMLYVLMLGVSMALVQGFVKFVQRKKTMNWRDYATGAAIAFWPVIIMISVSEGVVNMIITAVLAAIFVAFAIFIIKKV